MKEILERAKLLLEDSTLSDQAKEEALISLFERSPQAKNKGYDSKKYTIHIDKSINPFRMIHIVKELKAKDIAKMFGCTSTYITQIENGEKDPNNIYFLKNGFDKMGVSLDSYFTLREFAIILNNIDLKKEQKYQIMLIKTLGEIYPKLHQEAEEILSVNFGNLFDNNSTFEKK